jgi:ribosomal protein S18 acetylase RimI-like enzyme
VTFESVADNLRESFRVVAAGRGKGEIRELGGVSIASAGVRFQMFNAAFLSSPIATEAELAQRILLATLHFESRDLDWAYWVCEDMMEPRIRRASRRIFERHGLRHSVDLPGLLAERVAPPVKALPALEIRKVHDAATRDAFCAIASVCFHVPIQWFLEVFDNLGVWGRFAGYVGYLDGEPVSTTAIVMGGHAIGVYNVATIPQHQRRGYGETIMRHALARAYDEHGTERSILQSTPAGARLYQRMGYRAVAKIAVYASAQSD